MQIQAQARRVILELDMSQLRCDLLLDSDAIREAIEILIENAVEFSAEEQTVLVQFVRRAPIYEIFVLDKGPGVSPGRREEIFIPGESRPPPDRPKGAGLGLAIARHTIEGHGGRVECIDPPDGWGACFRIKIDGGREMTAAKE